MLTAASIATELGAATALLLQAEQDLRAGLKAQLASAEPEHLSSLRKELEQLLVDGSGFYERLVRAQEHHTLLEWINFKARWYLGGHEWKGRDVDVTAPELRRGGGAFSLDGSPGLLDITAQFPEYHPERPPERIRIALNGVEPAVKDMLRAKGNGYRLGDLQLNRVLRLEVHDRTGEFLDTPVLVTASGDVEPRCTDAALLVWQAYLEEQKLVYLMGELEERVAADPSLAKKQYAARGALKLLEQIRELSLEDLE